MADDADLKGDLEKTLKEHPNNDLLSALDAALGAVVDYVAAAREREARAEAAGNTAAASTHAWAAARLAPVTEFDFRYAASRLVRVVSLAIATGDTANAIWLSNRFEARKRREWLKTCQNHLLFLDPDFTLKALADEQRDAAITDLPRWLEWVEPSAAKLTPVLVSEALASKVVTVAGVAAKLACACGAFEYGSGDFDKAKKAFAAIARADDDPKETDE